MKVKIFTFFAAAFGFSCAVVASDFEKDVLCADQSVNRYLIMKADSDWSKPENLLWSWESGSAPELTSEQRKWFFNVSECKIVLNSSHILAVASGGGVALLNIKTKKAVFVGYAGGNTHSAELLPDGNIVAASSSGNFITLFIRDSDSRRVDPVRTIRYPFKDAHGCVYDKKQKLLWVLGSEAVSSYRYEQLPQGPALVLLNSYAPPDGSFPIADPQNPKSFSGHDL